MKRPRVTQFLPHMQREVEERLLRGEYRSLRALSVELAHRYGRISKSALGRLAQKLRAGEIKPRRADPLAEEQAIRDHIAGKGRRRPSPIPRLRATKRAKK